MSAAAGLESRLLPGARELLARHDRELPQRDDLCGAFCGSLALHAAGIGDFDQDDVAVAAGSIVSGSREDGVLPRGETGRRDYRLAIPQIDDGELSGTTAAGIATAIAQLSRDRLVAIPYSGPWNEATLGGVFDLALSCDRPVTLLANLATHHLWGGHPTPSMLLGHLYDGNTDGPPADWDVGHFSCVVARTTGPAGSLYAVVDTYPALGNRGVHLQPGPCLAAAIDRRDKPAGGILAVVSRSEAGRLRAGAESLGLSESLWDNGTITSVAAD